LTDEIVAIIAPGTLEDFAALVLDALGVVQHRGDIRDRLSRSVNARTAHKQLKRACSRIILDNLLEVRFLLPQHMETNRRARVQVEATVLVMHAVFEGVKNRNDVAALVSEHSSTGARCLELLLNSCRLQLESVGELECCTSDSCMQLHPGICAG
jgi:hypothetical protein